MTFALSKLIYPIEKPIELSSSLNYIIDNPRNDEEKEIVKNFIYESFDEEVKEGDTMAPISFRFALSIDELKKVLKDERPDSYELNYYNSNKEKNLIDILAETFIILRFPEDEEFVKIARNRDELFRSIYGNKNSDYSKKFFELSNYCYTLSLIANNEMDYHGESFLISENPYEIFFKAKNQNVYQAINDFINYNFSLPREERFKEWKYWFDGSEFIIENSKRLESLLIQNKIIEEGKKIRLSQKETPKQKIIHIGGLQRTAYEHLKDPELMLLLLVSIIEYLVTRNPDTNKFNVEDSISKQFKLKCAVLIHNQDKSYDLVSLSKDLNTLYSQRSDIAHGNYKEDFDTQQIVDSVLMLFTFLKYIVNEFIEDRKLLEYLKDH